MRIEVTARDIANAWKTCRRCPLAEAMGRLYPWADVSVYRTEVAILVRDHGRGRRDRTLQLPREAAEFVRAFDAGMPAEPFAFELPEPTA